MNKWIRRSLGVLVIAGGFWAMTGFHPLGDEGPFPGFKGATSWINSQPLTKESLKGKVVLVDFWTYSCINCLRSLPYVKAWHEKYKDRGLVVVGVHTPEFDFEKERPNVEARMKKLGITYAVAMDNDMAIWNAFRNQYWPAHYFIDAKGRIRHHHFGEGEYDKSEKVIQQLLDEADDLAKKSGVKPAGVASAIGKASSMGTVKVQATGEQAAATSFSISRSPETYLGTWRMERFSSREELAANKSRNYTEPRNLETDGWALGGTWKIGYQDSQLQSATGSLSYRFRARDLHLVMGSVNPGKTIRFRVTIDGKAPATDAGVDVQPDGTGIIKDYKLYQLVRLKDGVDTRTFRIEFLDPGVRVYAFTFG